MRKVLILLLMTVLLLPSCGIDTSKPIETETTSQHQQEYVNETVMLPSSDVRIISINLAYSRDNMAARGKLMMPLLLSYAPDSIGTQENGGYTDWLKFFEEELPNYERVGLVSTGDPDTTEHQSGNHIFYNADKYTCLDYDTIWLSHTPYFISSYRNGILRTCTWAILENKQTGFKYVHMNAHLGYETDDTNLFQVKLVQKLMLCFYELGLPVFLTGDFNTSEGSNSYQQMILPDEISDSKYEAEQSMTGGTFRGWNDKDLSSGKPIDYCFLTANVIDVHKYEIIDTFVDGVALSDHCGLFVNATVDPLRDPYVNPARPTTEGINVSETMNSPYIYEFTFTQSNDISLISSYHVELYDESNNLIFSNYIPSKHLDEDVSETKNCTFTCLNPGTSYSVLLSSVNLIGTESLPMIFNFTTPSITQ